MFEIKREVKALVLALEQRRFKAGRRPAKKRRQKESPQKQETDPQVNVTLKDLRVEAKELRRAHRAVSASETKSLGGFWHTPSPCRQREFVCPVCGSGGGVSLTPLDVSHQSADVERLELEKAILEKKAIGLQWKLRSHDQDILDLQADLKGAYGLCQELHGQLKKQTDEFQSFMVGVRASIGHWTAHQHQLKEEMDDLADQCAPGHAEVVKLAEELQLARQKLQASQRRKSRRESTKQHQATIQALQLRIRELGHEDAPPSEVLQLKKELLEAEDQNRELAEALEAHEKQAEDQAAKMEAALEQATQQGAESAKLEVKSSRAALAAAKVEGAKELPKGSVVGFLKMMAEGAPLWKLCAGKGKWQQRFLALTPGPPAAAKSLTWSTDAKYMGRRIFGRPTCVDIKEVVQISFGAEALPAGQRDKETEPWCCFSVWTPKRSFHFKAENEKIAENFVLGLSRLCPGSKPIFRSQLLLQRALGKLGPDAKSRAAVLSKALRQAAASRSPL